MFTKCKKEAMRRFKNQPEGTEDVVKIKDIEIPKAFKKHYPKHWKIERALDFYKQNGYVDKPISVAKVTNEKLGTVKYLLTDEYTRIIILINKKVDLAPVKYIDILH